MWSEQSVKYYDAVFAKIDNALRQAFDAIGVSLEDIKKEPQRFQHIIFPDGRQEYRWDGQRLVWLEPLKPPSYGLMIYGIKGKK